MGFLLNCASYLYKYAILLWLGKMTKSLFFFSFPFFSFLDLLHKDGAWESIMWLSITKVIGLWVTVRWYHMTKSHRNHGKKVHRPCSSCISSVGKLTGTPLSSPCQLRLGVDLSRHSLRPYIFTLIYIHGILQPAKRLLVQFPCPSFYKYIFLVIVKVTHNSTPFLKVLTLRTLQFIVWVL